MIFRALPIDHIFPEKKDILSIAEFQKKSILFTQASNETSCSSSSIVLRKTRIEKKFLIYSKLPSSRMTAPLI